MVKSIHDLSGLKHWLREVLRRKSDNTCELDQIYKHFEELGYRVEYTKGKRKYIKMSKL